MKEKQPKIAIDVIREQIEKTDGVECRLKPTFKPQVLIQLYNKNHTKINIYEYSSPPFNVFIDDEIGTVVFHLSIVPKELKTLMIDRMMCDVSIVTPWYRHAILGAMAEIRGFNLFVYDDSANVSKLISKVTTNNQQQ